ncbi:MAG: type II toxin-antitoxin system PemK/MazF family toxin [Candidatus Lambdaproteobacteria bacterium]|nr:type II toxin-antitoxin system PemK/MazF family toxin [Candidatus Lambdaproteobacteria bacterium]
MAFDAYDVVVVPFPFTDRSASKRRPALVLSDRDAFNEAVGQSVLAMITSRNNAPWPLDMPIADLSTAGLPAPSKVRMKLFTLDHRLILRKAGRLGPEDERNVRATLARLLGFAISPT